MTGQELRAFRLEYLGRMGGGTGRARLGRLLGFSDNKVRRREESDKNPALWRGLSFHVRGGLSVLWREISTA